MEDLKHLVGEAVPGYLIDRVPPAEGDLGYLMPLISAIMGVYKLFGGDSKEHPPAPHKSEEHTDGSGYVMPTKRYKRRLGPSVPWHASKKFKNKKLIGNKGLGMRLRAKYNLGKRQKGKMIGIHRYPVSKSEWYIGGKKQRQSYWTITRASGRRARTTYK